MTSFGRSLCTALLLSVALTCFGYAQSGTPAPLMDEAGVLSQKQRDEINALLSGHNQNGPGRIYVLIVDKLQPGMTIEQLAAARINQPPPAAKEKLDRVLLAIALQDRKMRVETSKGVWARLPDPFCKTVIDKTVAPHFKRQQYAEGIRAGTSELIKKLSSAD